MESSSSGSSKRAKGFENIRHIVSCMVDECNSDLSQCRDYHRRHKVCEFHSKTPKVTIGGREQRFCQQCSRFHSLEEFDDGKRSCRKRLDSHNRRRRKPLSDPLSTSPGRFIPSQQGTATLLSFNSTQQLLPSTMVGSSWATQNNVNGPFYSHDEPIANLSHFGETNQFKIVSGSDYPISEPLFPKTIFSKQNINHGSVSGNSNVYDTARVVDSDCALSLLSSATTAETRGIGLGYSSIVPQMQYCEEPMSSSYNNNNNNNNAHNNNNLHCHGLFHDGPVGPDGPAGNRPNPTLSFRWE